MWTVLLLLKTFQLCNGTFQCEEGQCRWILHLKEMEANRCVTMALKDLKLRAIFDGDFEGVDADSLDAAGEIPGECTPLP